MELERQTRWPRLRLCLVVLALVALSAGVLARQLSFQGRDALNQDDRRVAAALEYLRKDSSTDSFISRSKMLGAWLIAAERGYQVEVGLEDDGGYALLLTVTFDESGRPVDEGSRPWTARSLPGYFGRVAISLAVLLPLCGKLLPYVFGAKCPDCTGSAFLPRLLRVEDTIVYNGGWDAEGSDLPPIVKREFICRSCGYRKVTYRVGHWAYGSPWPFSGLWGYVPRVSPALADKIEAARERWLETLKKKARFKNYDEWKAYFDELKQSEHEQRP